MTSNPGRSVKSAERTLALFELFSREQQPFTVGHIATALNMPQASASMLLRNLGQLGYLLYDRTARTYAPSIRVALLGSWIDRRFGEASAVGTRLDALQRATDETAYLAIQNQAAVQYVLSQQPEHPDRLVVLSGQFRSLTCSSVGRILLTLKSDAEVRRWARRCNAEALEDRFRVREADFLDLIRRARQDGYATTDGDITPGLGSIAVTFTSPMGNTPMAVAVGGPMARIRRKRRGILAALLRFKAAFDAAAAQRR